VANSFLVLGRDDVYRVVIHLRPDAKRCPWSSGPTQALIAAAQARLASVGVPNVSR
jgi:hypothetical protein